MKERVRFAPSPTGPLHIGGLRTALYNYLYTKNKGGVFILRLEDTDRNRLVENSELYIQNALSWAGIIPDEGSSFGGEYGPYRQSERINHYNEKIKILIESGKAYYAFDSNKKLTELRKKKEERGLIFKYDYSTRDSLDNSLSMDDKSTIERIKKEPFVVRLKVDPGETVTEDLLRGWITVDNSVLDDKILIKTDGFPTYHFANVVDDHLMEISTVIRGEEWLPSLALHDLIYKAFDWQKPKFIHLPLILKVTGKGKLSKRDGTKGGFPVFPLKWEKEPGFKEMGFTNIGLINYLALLGWNPGDDEELFNLRKLIDVFSVEGIQKGGAKFDYEKAKWINQQHLSKMSFDSFEKTFPENIPALRNKYPSRCNEIFFLIKERLKLAVDFKEETQFFLKDPSTFDEKVIRKLQSKNDVKDVLEHIEVVIVKNGLYEIEENLNTLADNKKINYGIIMQLLRLSLVGKLSGPDIIKVSLILEKAVTLKRIINLKNHIINNL